MSNKKIALQEDIIDYDAYKLKPNKMQEEFICSVHDLIERGANFLMSWKRKSGQLKN